METNQEENLSNVKTRKGAQKDEKSGDSTEVAGKEEKKKEKKKYNLYLTGLAISRELVLRFVLFCIVYLMLTRAVKIFLARYK